MAHSSETRAANITATIAERDFLDTSLEGRRIFAEIWGSFLLVLAAVGAHVAHHGGAGDFFERLDAVAPGLMVMVAIYSLGSVSGAHLNPAVTLAFALRANFPWRRVPGYIAAQVLGAAAACALLYAVFGAAVADGATAPRSDLTALQAAFIEAVLTAALINTILATASGARNVGTNAGIAVGGYIVLAGLWAAPLTGASMNPARSMAVDLVMGTFSNTWIYLAGPFLGAAIGVAFEWILKGAPTPSGSAAAQGEDSKSPS